MKTIYACIAERGNPAAVCDWAAWAALRLAAPLEFLHVLDRHPERAPAHDLSGSIGLGAQESLLQELSSLDAERSRLAQEHGRQLLEAARTRAAQAGVHQASTLQRHGELVDTVVELQDDARLYVLGEHHHAPTLAKLHLDHHVERVVRSVKRPVLVVAGDRPATPQRFVLACDGSATARAMVDAVAASPLLRGLPCLLATAGEPSAAQRSAIDSARDTLAHAGFAVETVVQAGEPEAVLQALVRDRAVDLLVMGAYGHSRIRHLIVGSTTTTMLRTSEVPVLILR